MSSRWAGHRKTLQVAQPRIRTALNRVTPEKAAAEIDEELAAALAALGLQVQPCWKDSPRSRLSPEG